MLHRIRRRYLDVLASIYLFNEHRGYSSLDRVLDAVRLRHPGGLAFITAVEKHRADERNHYMMFRGWFERQGRMPLAVDKSCAHIDRMIRLTFGCDIDGLDTARVIADDALFARLCRIIVLTERRGMWQVSKLLAMPIITSDRPLHKIFKIIERDEPSHWLPYDGWLRGRGEGRALLREKAADWWVHKSLVLFKLPVLFLNPWLRRRTDWQDASDGRAIPRAPG